MDLRIRTKKRLGTFFLIITGMALLIVFGRSFGVLFILANILTVFAIKGTYNLYHSSGNRLFRIANRLITIGYLLFILSFLVIEGFIIHEIQSSKHTNHENVDYVIILGAGLHGDQLSKTLEGRLVAAVDYLNQHEDVPVIVSGGQGPGEWITEAEAMGRYLLEQGIDEKRIYYEHRSTSTYENIGFSKEIMKELGGENSTVTIVTSDYHILRAKMIGKELGLECYGVGGDSPFFVKVNYLIREYFGVAKTVVGQMS
ncbi:YdcF family protein [Bacillus alkalicellulosilyticus]|uniref:YdcF family protein n=1 Tax=Alkalihalobacterium alkalicellulosilyticum TaxID=1912214 RepID=UPI0009984518|nr:YdcF family protein [Bacillus alkalicellulosilyticus]